MTSDAAFALIIVNIPVVGAAVAAGIYWIPRWRRRSALRKLDAMFEADREWWEAQFDDVGHERPEE
jgi:hypothetical protein